jgi:hypothetical protein
MGSVQVIFENSEKQDGDNTLLFSLAEDAVPRANKASVNVRRIAKEMIIDPLRAKGCSFKYQSNGQWLEIEDDNTVLVIAERIIRKITIRRQREGRQLLFCLQSVLIIAVIWFALQTIVIRRQQQQYCHYWQYKIGVRVYTCVVILVLISLSWQYRTVRLMTNHKLVWLGTIMIAFFMLLVLIQHDDTYITCSSSSSYY